MASRPRARAASISSRYGSHALAAGARPGRAARSAGWRSPAEGPRGRWTPLLAGFAAGWPAVAAGDPHGEPGGLEVGAGRLAPHARRPLDAPERPAQPAQVPELPVVLSSPKMLVMLAEEPQPSRRVNVLGRLPHWPVFRCRRLAGFGCRPRAPRVWSPRVRSSSDRFRAERDPDPWTAVRYGKMPEDPYRTRSRSPH